MDNKQVALKKKDWILYQWASSKNNYAWTFYVRDDQKEVISWCTDREDALDMAIEVWDHRIREKALLKLHTLHTRKLLNMLAGARYSGYGWDDDSPILCEEYEYEADDIRAILKYRPHIPNKKEAKKIRRERAKNRRYDRLKFRNRHHTKAKGFS